MKIITAVLIGLSLSSSVAYAGNAYQQALARKDFCDHASDAAHLAYLGRVAGDPKQRYEEKFAPEMHTGDRGDAIIRFALDYGYDQALDVKDARMKTWAYCMDHSN